MQPRVTVHDAAMRLDGPLLFMRRTLEVGLNEAVVVTGRDGAPRLGRIAAIDEELVTIEMLEPTAGLGLADTVVRFLGEPIDFGVGPGVLGRVFNGIGEVIDGGPATRGREALADRWRAAEPGYARHAARIHRIGRHRGRPDELAGTRPEAAHLLGRRPAT